jgi:sporulation protein YlmC with PRC-barrel domain
MENPIQPELLSGSKLIGSRIRNWEGKNLGKIEDIMIDLESGAIAYAVLSFGGFLGLGDKLFPVPWEVLAIDMDSGEFILDVDPDVLQDAPGWDKSELPNVTYDWLADIYEYYECDPYWEIISRVRRDDDDWDEQEP